VTQIGAEGGERGLGNGQGNWLRGLALSAGVAVGAVFGVAVGGAGLMAMAQSVAADIETLNALTRQVETFEIMRLEGIDTDKSLGVDLFGDAEDPTWLHALNKVYATERMSRIYSEAASAVLDKDPTLVAEASVFLGSDLGQRIIGLELEARRTALDRLAMGAAREVYAEMEREDKDRAALLQRLVDAADLMEGNVTSAMNSNIAFTRAFGAASEVGGTFDEAAMLADVASREPEIRLAVADFVFPLMALAYSPLKIEDLTAYVEFFESDAGQRFNRVVIAGFDPLMIDLATRLGAEAGRLMSGQEL
jgi:hypothetical protein